MTNHPNPNSFPRRGVAVAGMGGLALASVLLLCGAGNAPIENFTPQGTMQADLNAGGHNVTNAATVSATNVTVSGALTATNFTLPFANVTTKPTTLAGYGIADAESAAAAASSYVPKTTSVNGHALSGNVTVSASDLTTGTLPIAQVPVGNTLTTVAPGSGSSSYLAPNGSGAALTGINNYVAPISITGAGTTTLTRGGPTTEFLLNVSAGTAYTNSVALSTSGAMSGDKMEVTLAFPVSATPPSLPFYNGSTGGTLLLTSTTNGLAAAGHTLRFAYDGTKWNLQTDGAVLTKNLGSGVSAVITNPANAPNGPTVVDAKTYYVDTYAGGPAGGKIVTDAAFSTSSTTLTSASANFTAANVGNVIVLQDSTTVRQSLTIAAVNSSTSVTLSSTPTATVSGGTVYFGPSRTAAIRSALAAALSTGGRVKFGSGIYMIPDAPGDTSTYNSIFEVIGNNTPNFVWMEGEGSAALGPGNAPGNPSTNGTILYCSNTSVTGTLPSIFSSVAPGFYGSSSFGFASTFFRLANLTVRQPGNPQMTGIQWENGGPLQVENVSFDQDLPMWSSATPDPTTGAAYAILCPIVNDPAWTEIKNVLAYGYFDGIEVGEHANIDGWTSDYCKQGMSFSSTVHGVHVARALLQQCTIPIQCTSTLNAGKFYVEADEIDVESSVTGNPWIPTWTHTTYTLNDPSNYAYGIATIFNTDSNGNAVYPESKNGGANLVQLYPRNGNYYWNQSNFSITGYPGLSSGIPLINLKTNDTSAAAISLNNTSSGGLNWVIQSTGSSNNAGSFSLYSPSAGYTPLTIRGSAFSFVSNQVLGWSASSPYASPTEDTGLSRDSTAGTIDVGNGTGLDTSGSIKLKTLTASGGVQGAGSAPAIAAGTGAGTSPTLAIAGTNLSGDITLTTGTSPAAIATIATITLANSYTASTHAVPVLTPENLAAAGLGASAPYCPQGGTTTWTIASNTSALAAGTAYVWHYTMTSY